MTKKLSVTVEKRGIKLLTRPHRAGKAFCAECQTETRWLVPEEAMVLAGITLREVFRLVEARELHFAENGDGCLIVCAESLTTKARKE